MTAIPIVKACMRRCQMRNGLFWVNPGCHFWKSAWYESANIERHHHGDSGDRPEPQYRQARQNRWEAYSDGFCCFVGVAGVSLLIQHLLVSGESGSCTGFFAKYKEPHCAKSLNPEDETGFPWFFLEKCGILKIHSLCRR